MTHSSSKTPWWPIRTGQTQVPWSWITILSLPWASMVYFDLISNVAMTFKLREFISVPLLLTLAGSFNLLFNIMVGATCNYASDRMWTPWGRRKPFLLVGWIVVAIGCTIIPALTSLALIITLLFVYEMLRDLATPYESLCNEIVPPGQRGRANAAYTFSRQGIVAVFFSLVIGRWDETFTLPGGFVLTGQQLVFWSASALAIVTVLLVSRVREEPPAEKPAPWRRPEWTELMGHARNFFKEVFGSRQWRAIYTVALAQMIFWTDFGSLQPLLYTEQWGFSKQMYGNLLAVASGVTLVVFLPLSGWVADRWDRVRMFQLLAGAMALNHLAFFVYLKVFTGAAPSLTEVLVFKLVGTGIGTVGTVASVAMMFDYVPRNRMGTVLAGVGLARGVAMLFVNNGIGLWVTGASWFFPSRDAAGEMKYNYSLGYVYLALCGWAAWWVARRFARLSRTGVLVPLGVQEAAERAAAK